MKPSHFGVIEAGDLEIWAAQYGQLTHLSQRERDDVAKDDPLARSLFL